MKTRHCWKNSASVARFVALALAVALGSTALVACNIFDPFDNPTTDKQLLSAARAALDRGDITEAKDLYQRISGSFPDIAASETAFATLEQNGAGMGTFMVFVGNNANGVGLTRMAERMAGGDGQTRRAALYTAYQVGISSTAITDLELRNFVKFTSALGLVAEILSESVSGSSLDKTAIAASASCVPGGGACAANTACNTGTGLPAGTFGDLDSNNPGSVATANSQMLNEAITKANAALNALNPGGNFAGSSGGFANIIGAGPNGTNNDATERCFRAFLLDFGVGN